MKEDEFLELVERYKDHIYRHAFYLLGNSEDAEDITQETFIKAWEQRGRLRHKTVRSWLLKCAQNLCFNLLKRQKFQEPLTIGDETELETLLHTHSHRSNPSPDELVEKEELKEMVQGAIKKLPPELRAVIIMRELEGMSYKEIAKVLNRPVNTVKGRVSQARKKLRELLRPYWSTNK